MRRGKKRNLLPLIPVCLWILCGIVLIAAGPSSWWIETILFLLVLLTIGLTSGMALRKLKWGLVVGVGIGVLLLINRLRP
jgi:hypothetical protein